MMEAFTIITSGFYQKENAASSLNMWPAYSEDCGHCFISLIGETSEDKDKTKDLTEKLNTGLDSPLCIYIYHCQKSLCSIINLIIWLIHCACCNWSIPGP